MASGETASTLLPIDLQRSLTDATYDRLVDAIATDKLPPGARLNQRDLAEQLMVSRQPISHALHRLKATGLAVEIGRKGLVVAPVDLARLRDLYDLRTEIEGLVSVRAAGNVKAGACQPADIAQMQHLLARGAAFTMQTPVLDCIAADVEFHLCLYRLCGSLVISEAAAPLWPHFRRSMGRALSIDNHRQISWRGHAAIAAAVLAGDPDAARKAARVHIEIAADAALRSLGGSAAAEAEAIAAGYPARNSLTAT